VTETPKPQRARDLVERVFALDDFAPQATKQVDPDKVGNEVGDDTLITSTDAAASDDDSHAAPSPERLDACLSQIMLRIFNAAPVLMTYLESDRVKDDTIELSFFKLPKEIMFDVKTAFGISDVKTLHYTKNNHPCVGYILKPTKEELSALSVDDSSDHELTQQNADPTKEADSLLPDTDNEVVTVR
jgi:hypothetical protein